MSAPEAPTDELKLDWVVKDVCDWFGVSRWTVYEWMKKEGDEQIPHHRPGGGIPRFSSAEVKAWGVSQ